MSQHTNHPKLTNRLCPVCEANKGSVLHQQNFILPADHPLTAGYDIVCCVQCGFVFADVSATQADYDTFYEQFSKYEDSHTATGSGEADWDAKRLTDTSQELLRHFSSHAALLDFGCANGGLLRALAQQGFDNLHGVDPSFTCANIASCMRNATIHVGTFSHPPAELKSYDGIILSHVLEHVLHVKEALQLVRKLLNPQGMCYVEVPDATRYSEFYVSPFHFFDTEHINHFDINSLENALRSSGLQPIKNGAKLTDVTEGIPYPAIWVLAQKCEESTDETKKSNELYDAITNYIALSQDAYPIQLLTKLANSREGLIIWGVGCSTLRLLAETPLGKANIIAFTDSNPMHHGKTILGRPVIPPSNLSQFLNTPIVITSKLYGSQISAQIQRDLSPSHKIIMCYSP